MHALEREMSTQSSILAWRILGTEETCGLPSLGSHRVRHDWSDLAAAAVPQLLLSLNVEVGGTSSTLLGPLKVKVAQSIQLFATPWTITARLFCTWNSPGKNTGVDCHALLQGIFLTQRNNQCLLHCRQILYQESPSRPLVTREIKLPTSVGS